jgi:hypothetical protein
VGGVGGCGLCSLWLHSFSQPWATATERLQLTASACFSCCLDVHSSVGVVWEVSSTMQLGVPKDSTMAAAYVSGLGGCGLCSLLIAATSSLPWATATGVIVTHSTRIFLLLACAQ